MTTLLQTPKIMKYRKTSLMRNKEMQVVMRYLDLPERLEMPERPLKYRIGQRIIIEILMHQRIAKTFID